MKQVTGIPSLLAKEVDGSEGIPYLVVLGRTPYARRVLSPIADDYRDDDEDAWAGCEDIKLIVGHRDDNDE